MPKKTREYDDDALVMALARGDKSRTKIAKEFGLAVGYVYDIAAGRRRPELQERIAAVRGAADDEMRKLARKLARAAMARLAKLLGPDTKPTAEVQRRAAMDIIRLAAGDRPADEGGGESPELGVRIKLTSQDLEVLARAHGGPKA